MAVGTINTNPHNRICIYIHMHVSTVWCGANWRKENNMWLILVYRSSNYQGQQTQDETNLERSDVKSWSQSWRKDGTSIFNMSCVIKNISVWPDGMIIIWTRHGDQYTTRCSFMYYIMFILIFIIVSVLCMIYSTAVAVRSCFTLLFAHRPDRFA